MTISQSFEESNSAYLHSAVAWLRHKLSLIANPGNDDEAILGLKAAMDEAERASPTPAIVLMQGLFGLSDFEKNMLLLCCCMEFDTRIPALCASAQGDPGKPYPTFGLGMALFDQPSWEAISPSGPLRHWRLIEPTICEGRPIIGSPLYADERISGFIMGLSSLDHRLLPYLIPFGGHEDFGMQAISCSQRSVASALSERIDSASIDGQVPAVQLLGSNSSSKLALAAAVSMLQRRQMFRIDSESLPSSISEIEELARLWQRESLMQPLLLFFQQSQSDASTSEAARSMIRLVSRTGCLSFLDVQGSINVPGRTSLCVEVDLPSSSEQRKEWEKALGVGSDATAALLAGQFNMELSSIRRIAGIPGCIGEEVSSTSSSDGSRVPIKRLWRACLEETMPQLGILARRIDARAGWDDLVLPQSELALLRLITAQVRQRSRVYDLWGFRRRMNRGLGVSALFAGDSGTGKTMAAEVIAGDLDLSLYRIDLSTVVSKYIGETEKNLRRVFDAAERGGAILFFDEADALFGKRSEVKDSHDRYANLEISYLLQRMEAFSGLSILATNMKSFLDRAFLRRLRFVVNFPFPGQSQRLEIWKRAIPEQTPTSGLDLRRLSEINLTGGSIHSIALNAAFLAAELDQPLGMETIMQSARWELRKMERPISESELRL